MRHEKRSSFLPAGTAERLETPGERKLSESEELQEFTNYRMGVLEGLV